MRPLLLSLLLLILAHLALATGAATQPQTTPEECPTITIETPAQVICPGAEVTFRARIEGVALNTRQTYKWTVSTGRIISGQGTPEIKVETLSASPDSVYKGIGATVDIGGITQGCSNTASYGVKVDAFCPERKLDEFGELSFDEEKARLESFITRLVNDPDTMGLIRAHSGSCARMVEAEARLERIRDYLVNLRGLDRIVTKDDGCQEGAQAELMIELWLMPTKAPPVPPPVIDLKEAQNNNDPTAKPASP
ncbi:MAG TPA: hypothetical protein VGX92_00865 [Pyrinomonadaceae bacterium]|jgi:hypothetical protein|nr:hypothetical protein [Pyrinomonadaceae bacterium]